MYWWEIVLMFGVAIGGPMIVWWASGSSQTPDLCAESTSGLADDCYLNP